jgi:hypothetical protein
MLKQLRMSLKLLKRNWYNFLIFFIILIKKDKEMRMFHTKNLPMAKAYAEVTLLNEENLRLKSLLNAVYAEIYGSRLAAKYLDKELAGRFV